MYQFRETVDVYSAGVSEEIVGKALKGRREDVFLATKVFMPMDQDDPNQRGGPRRWIIRAVENSLRRLGTDHIDLYQVHRPSPDTDVSETLGALTDLVRQGKVRYIGSSSYSGSQIVEARWTSRERNLERFVTEQPPYSILVRGIEEDVLPTARRHGMGTLTEGPTSAARPQERCGFLGVRGSPKSGGHRLPVQVLIARVAHRLSAGRSSRPYGRAGDDGAVIMPSSDVPQTHRRRLAAQRLDVLPAVGQHVQAWGVPEGLASAPGPSSGGHARPAHRRPSRGRSRRRR